MQYHTCKIDTYFMITTFLWQKGDGEERNTQVNTIHCQCTDLNGDLGVCKG